MLGSYQQPDPPNRWLQKYLDVVQARSEDNVWDGELHRGFKKRRRTWLAAAGRRGSWEFVYVKSPPQGVQRGFGGWKEKDQSESSEMTVTSSDNKLLDLFPDFWRLTFDQGFGAAVTQLTNQVVEATRETRLTASLLFGVRVEALERSLKRGRQKQGESKFICRQRWWRLSWRRYRGQMRQTQRRMCVLFHLHV